MTAARELLPGQTTGRWGRVSAAWIWIRLFRPERLWCSGNPANEEEGSKQCPEICLSPRPVGWPKPGEALLGLPYRLLGAAMVAEDHGERFALVSLEGGSVAALKVMSSISGRSALDDLGVSWRVSIAANVAVAETTVTGRVIAAWPSFALIGSYELLMRQVRCTAWRTPLGCCG
jgi:hypothetical protein